MSHRVTNCASCDPGMVWPLPTTVRTAKRCSTAVILCLGDSGKRFEGEWNFQRELKILNTRRHCCTPSANQPKERQGRHDDWCFDKCALGDGAVSSQHILACKFCCCCMYLLFDFLFFLKVDFSCFACITVVWNRFGCCIFFAFFLRAELVPWESW